MKSKMYAVIDTDVIISEFRESWYLLDRMLYI